MTKKDMRTLRELLWSTEHVIGSIMGEHDWTKWNDPQLEETYLKINRMCLTLTERIEEAE